MSPVRVRKNGFGFYILESTAVKNHAWSGARWSPIDKDGLPTSIAQVCSFASRKDAKEYARKVGLTLAEGESLSDVAE